MQGKGTLDRAAGQLPWLPSLHFLGAAARACCNHGRRWVGSVWAEVSPSPEVLPSRAHNPQVSGRVAWTGSSSMDVRVELEQGGQQQLSALFTFVARDVMTNRAHPITPVLPKSKQVATPGAAWLGAGDGHEGW